MAEAISTSTTSCLTCPVRMQNTLIWPTCLPGISVIWAGIIFKWMLAANCSNNPLLSLNPEEDGERVQKGLLLWLLFVQCAASLFSHLPQGQKHKIFEKRFVDFSGIGLTDICRQTLEQKLAGCMWMRAETVTESRNRLFSAACYSLVTWRYEQPEGDILIAPIPSIRCTHLWMEVCVCAGGVFFLQRRAFWPDVLLMSKLTSQPCLRMTDRLWRIWITREKGRGGGEYSYDYAELIATAIGVLNLL